MKLTFFKIKIVVLFLFLFQNQSLIGKEHEQFEQVRCYVETENIGICDDGILLLDGESLILVKSLFHDEEGFYFYDTDGCAWICNWCKSLNPLDISICQRCGEPQGSSRPKKNQNLSH